MGFKMSQAHFKSGGPGPCSQGPDGPGRATPRGPGARYDLLYNKEEGGGGQAGSPGGVIMKRETRVRGDIGIDDHLLNMVIT